MIPATPAKLKQPDPRDRWTWYSVYWLLWLGVGFGVPEAMAIREDKIKRDRAKRTLSSNTRRATAYDSIDGQPLNVPYAKVRRLAFVVFMAWFADHIKARGSM